MRNFMTGGLQDNLNKEWEVFKTNNPGKSDIELVAEFIVLMETAVSAFDISYPYSSISEWSGKDWNAAFHVVNGSRVITCYASERFSGWGCKA